MIILMFIISLILSYTSLYFYKIIGIRYGWYENNYRNKKILSSSGIVIFIPYLFLNYLFMYFYNIQIHTYFYYLNFIIVFLTGLIDDRIGNKKIKGLKGHLIYFFKTKLPTTGLFKLIIGLLIALIYNLLMFGSNFLVFLINFIGFSLFLNIINLFDLRPLRGIKVFIILMLLLINNIWELCIILGILIIIIIDERKELSMLGDAGSNLLGFLLAIWFIEDNIHLLKKILIIIFLIFVHLYAEKKSISLLINSSKTLSYLDRLGRKFY